jgi:hypothetical protein
MYKQRLETKMSFMDFMSQVKPHYHIDWSSDEEPKSYPCILVYNIVDNQESYKENLYYTFIYKEDLL